jgi:hypothetical protein
MRFRRAAWADISGLEVADGIEDWRHLVLDSGMGRDVKLSNEGDVDGVGD